MPAILAPSPSVEPAIQHLRSFVDALQMAAIDGDLPAMADIVNELHESGWRLYEAVAGDRDRELAAAQVAYTLQPDPVVQAYKGPEILRSVLLHVLGQEKLRRATA